MIEFRVCIDDHLYEILQVVAEDQETSADEIVTRALESYLKVWLPPGWEGMAPRNRH
jgi:hypothetical protein